MFATIGGYCLRCRVLPAVGTRPHWHGKEADKRHSYVYLLSTLFQPIFPNQIAFVAIVEDARTPQRYRMLLSTVDVIFADVAQPDQARIISLNAEYFLKNGGHVVISIKASCIDSTVAPEAVFAREVETLRQAKIKPLEQVTLEPYERDHAMVTGVYQRHQ